MSKHGQICKECDGRGRWVESTPTTGMTEQVWYECGTCKGTGVNQDPEAGDDYDIDGDSYEDDE